MNDPPVQSIEKNTQRADSLFWLTNLKHYSEVSAKTDFFIHYVETNFRQKISLYD
jgi:hypothetical protein